jgi:hypothetical protein
VRAEVTNQGRAGDVGSAEGKRGADADSLLCTAIVERAGHLALPVE